jgi:hypothetical protein
MINSLISDETENVSRGNDSSSWGAFVLKTSEVYAIDIRDAVVVLIIFCLADIDPFFGVGLSVED